MTLQINNAVVGNGLGDNPANSSGSGQSEKSPTQPLILIAEDNDINRETLVDFISFNDYRVIEARDGAEAINQIQTQQPDLVLMDVRMPGIDGLEAMRHVRNSGNRVPIIALTGAAMAGDNHVCMTAGASAYLTKPVSLVTLIKAIKRQLAKVG